jgi:hypothetical protein
MPADGLNRRANRAWSRYTIPRQSDFGMREDTSAPARLILDKNNKDAAHARKQKCCARSAALLARL